MKYLPSCCKRKLTIHHRTLQSVWSGFPNNSVLIQDQIFNSRLALPMGCCGLAGNKKRKYKSPVLP